MSYFFDDIQSMSVGGEGRSNDSLTEDAFAYNKHNIIVMDGATIVDGIDNHFFDNASDAYWLSNSGCSLMMENLSNEISLHDALNSSLYALKSEYESALGGISNSATPADVPNSTLSCARIKGEELQIMQLGDSPISVKLTDGTYICMPGDENLEAISKNNTDDITSLLRSGNTIEEAREALRPQCIDMRRSQCNNAFSDSYSIFAFVGMEHIDPKIMCLPVSEVESICIYSDGYADLMLFDDDLDMEKLHEKTMRSIPDSIAELLCEQMDDADCISYPRFKRRDDITVVSAYIRME